MNSIRGFARRLAGVVALTAVVGSLAMLPSRSEMPLVPAPKLPPPPSSVVDPMGVIHYPDGCLLYPNGYYVYPNGASGYIPVA